MLAQLMEVRLVVAGEIDIPHKKITQPIHALENFRFLLADKDREYFMILILNTKNEVVGIHTVSIGNVRETIVHPREVFKAAILANATGIICAHNHPSGHPEPSDEDHQVTDRLIQAGDIIGILVMDHLVIGRDGAYYSFREAGLI